ncbi:hypothetical protein ACHAXR_005480 [Thalassiosira sp. AJA248-18]
MALKQRSKEDARNKSGQAGSIEYVAPLKQSAAAFNNTKIQNTSRKTRKEKKKYHYHDYAIFIVHYHKTGYVLSRELKNLVREIEVKTNRPNDDPAKYLNPVKYEVSGLDDETGERVAFDQVGNWARSAFPQRRHSGKTDCPKQFDLKMGKIYVQESPDLFCSDSDILSAMSASKGGTKIIHFVRGAFDMAMSNYFYHSQEPTPEKWVHTDDPCQHLYMDEEPLSSHIVPTLASWVNRTAKGNEVTQQQMDGIADMCKSLYQNKSSLKQSTFYEHLLKLDKTDGLRLATAQMTVASGEANRHMAGGDILRMANNLVKFENLRQTPKSNIHLLTVSMDEFIKDTANSTMQFLDFIFGDRKDSIPRKKRLKAAKAQEEKYDRKKKISKHVTQTNSEGKKNKEELRQMLMIDEDLGAILNLTDILVNEALSQYPDGTHAQGSDKAIIDACAETRQFPIPRKVTFPPIKQAWTGEFAAKRMSRYEGCMRFKCANYTEPHCQDNFADTDYTGGNPPCCTHVLRDMIRTVDDALCGLGLEYFAGYGTLLGLIRDDHVIPWTADNDFVVSFAVAEEIWKQRAYLRDNFGLNIFNDFYLRTCISESFMGGALLKWETKKFDKVLAEKGQYVDHFPYADFFYGDVDPVSGKFIDERGCGYDLSSYRPAARLMVYKQKFPVSVPKDYNLVLDAGFGSNWRTPDSGNPHGHTECDAKKFMRIWNMKGADKEWISHWNGLLNNARP